MKKPFIIGAIWIIAIISIGTNSFAQTDSQTLPTEKEPIQGIAELIEQVDDTIDDQVSFQINEESVQNLTNLLPYLGIIIAVVIVGIIVIKKRKKGEDDEDSEDYEYYDDEEKGLIPRSKPIEQKFQEMQAGSQSDIINETEPDEIIENKLRIISKLQEYKVGDNHRLEQIKQLLIADGSFTIEDNDYLEAKYEEYKKSTKKKSDE